METYRQEKKMSQPKLGMHYNDCAKRIKRIKRMDKGDKRLQDRLIDSLKGQADLNQPGAWEELAKETSTTIAFSGSGSKQIVSINFCKKCHFIKEYCKCEGSE